MSCNVWRPFRVSISGVVEVKAMQGLHLCSTLGGMERKKRRKSYPCSTIQSSRAAYSPTQIVRAFFFFLLWSLGPLGQCENAVRLCSVWIVLQKSDVWWNPMNWSQRFTSFCTTSKNMLSNPIIRSGSFTWCHDLHPSMQTNVHPQSVAFNWLWFMPSSRTAMTRFADNGPFKFQLN